MCLGLRRIYMELEGDVPGILFVPEDVSKQDPTSLDVKRLVIEADPVSRPEPTDLRTRVFALLIFGGLKCFLEVLNILVLLL